MTVDWLSDHSTKSGGSRNWWSMAITSNASWPCRRADNWSTDVERTSASSASTLAAFELAISLGADSLELDVVPTSDAPHRAPRERAEQDHGRRLLTGVRRTSDHEDHEQCGALRLVHR